MVVNALTTRGEPDSWKRQKGCVVEQLQGERLADAAVRASFYTVDRDRFIPGPACRSPWNRQHQNGAAIAGIVAHVLDRTEAPRPMLAARLTIDILRPTPFAPFHVETQVVRQGHKMQVIEASIVSDGQVTVRACMLRLRKAESPTFEEPLPYPPVESCSPRRLLHKEAVIEPMVETLAVHGDFVTPGPAAIWARFNADIAPGAPAAGLVQTAMLSDFGNGLSAPLVRAEWSYANVDISLHQVREPEGSWVLLASETSLQGEGVAQVNTTLGDERGIFGRAHQTLFIERRANQR